MRACRLVSLLALVAAGCGGAGEARQPIDGGGDVPIDLGGGGGAGGAAGTTGAGGSAIPGAEVGATCTTAAECKRGFCFDGQVHHLAHP